MKQIMALMGLAALLAGCAAETSYREDAAGRPSMESEVIIDQDTRNENAPTQGLNSRRQIEFPDKELNEVDE